MSKKLFIYSSLFLTLIIFTSSFSSVVRDSENISQKVFRFHILANSVEEYDQNLKLMVRDELLCYSNSLFNNCSNVDEAILIAKENVSNFNHITKEVILENGYDYSVKTYVTKEYFNTRVYDNYTLPAGLYDSLKVVIGSGEGHNWWCVMFPAVCLSSSADDFGDYLNEDEKALIDDKYVIKFKAIEIYESIKNKIK